MCEKFLETKVVRGGKARVTFRDQTIDEEEKDFGIFALVSNIDKDPAAALGHYRIRNLIEESCRVIKADLDGRRPRAWTRSKARGKEVCWLVALGLRIFLADAFGRIRQRAAENSRDSERFSQAERDEYATLASWLAAMTADRILAWFDCIETVTVRNSRGRARWTTERIRRDKLFQKMLAEL